MNERISISELAGLLADRAGMLPEEANAFVRRVFALIEEALEEDKLAKIKGLGTFKLVSVSSRESVAVNTGERIVIEGYNKVTFTPEATLRDLINKPFAHFEPVLLNDGINFVEEEASDEPSDEPSDEEEVVVEEIVERAPKSKKKSPSRKHVKEEREDEEEEKSAKPTVKKTVPEKENLKADTIANAPSVPLNEHEIENKTAEKKVLKNPASETQTGKTAEKEAPSAAKKTTPLTVTEKVVTTDEQIIAAEAIVHAPEHPLEGDAGTKTVTENGEETVFVKKRFSRTLEIEPPHEKLASGEDREDERLKKEVGEEMHILSSPRRTYIVPFLICLSLLLVVLAVVAGAYIYRPQWLKDALGVEEGPSITFVTVDAKDVALRPTLEPPTSKEPTLATQAEESATVVDTEAETQPSSSPAPLEIQPVADGKANPKDFKIVGLLETVQIESGKSLMRIAKQYYGSRDLWTLIVEYNKDVISNPDHIPVGSTLKIPKLERK